ncbi:SMI1/KNR4 family protein [Priestia endophytica]|uniref:SMI1/KNR4 family protein n=1 Tax=Priestia endophytica TaxID=135735 RepID=UPI00227F3EE6|nr:SMI1/KNR4 family protein [Priestia endophytica]MCY8232277.1 SMI1/KNR4 family protein [Priestia endophytica]
MISIDYQGPKIALRDIGKLEGTPNITLPQQYVDFLLQYNGGYPKESTFKISDDEGESLVNKFYHLNDLDRVFEILEGEISDEFLSIANDPGENEILLGVSEEYFGEVYVWVHNREEENLFFLSNNFSAFCLNLSE